MMTDEKILEAIANVEQHAESAMPKRCDERRSYDLDLFDDMRTMDQHIAFMCQEMRSFLAEGRREKVMRWLGFAQGALWARGMPLADLMAMNKPDYPKF